MAQLEDYARSSKATKLTPALVARARFVIDGLFDGRDRMSLTEAEVARLVLTITHNALVAASAAAHAAGDLADDAGER